MTTPQHLSDRYELGEILGFGGMSEVHIARDLRLHRDVAVKVLRADLARDPSFYLRFRREAQNAAALNHPAIVAVYDTGEAETATGPLPYIVMEYVDGVTLRDIVHNDGPMPARRAIETIADACQALNFSHQHGIIHRDVKPANIMISKAGAVKVMDFGIARAIADSGNSVTQTAAVIGTAQYLSPEQARGDAVDARSDVYSLGCVLYEILTGEPPFIGDSPVAVAYQHVREDPVPPSHRHAGISPELDAVVLKALAKNPDNRYQTAAEMRADLVKVHSGEAPDAPKVLTDAERRSMLAAAPSHGRSPSTEQLPQPMPEYVERERGGSVGRWLIAVAALAVLTVVVTIAINMIGGDPRDVQVPDVKGQASADAIAALQNAGFKTRTQQKPDSTVPPDHVINTDPDADTSVERRRRDHHQRVHRPGAARGARCVVADLRRGGAQAHRRRLRELQAGVLIVAAGDEGQGAGHQSAGQSDHGDHQRDHHRGGLRSADPGGPRRQGPTLRSREAEPHRVRIPECDPERGGQHRTRG